MMTDYPSASCLKLLTPAFLHHDRLCTLHCELEGTLPYLIGFVQSGIIPHGSKQG